MINSLCCPWLKLKAIIPSRQVVINLAVSSTLATTVHILVGKESVAKSLFFFDVILWCIGSRCVRRLKRNYALRLKGLPTQHVPPPGALCERQISIVELFQTAMLCCNRSLQTGGLSRRVCSYYKDLLAQTVEERLSFLDFDSTLDDPPYPGTRIEELAYYMTHFVDHESIYNQCLAIVLKDASSARCGRHRHVFEVTIESILNGARLYRTQSTSNTVVYFVFYVLYNEMGVTEYDYEGAWAMPVVDRIIALEGIDVLIGDLRDMCLISLQGHVIDTRNILTVDGFNASWIHGWVFSTIESILERRGHDNALRERAAEAVRLSRGIH